MKKCLKALVASVAGIVSIAPVAMAGTGAAPVDYTLGITADLSDVLSWISVFWAPIWPFLALGLGFVVTGALVFFIIKSGKKAIPSGGGK